MTTEDPTPDKVQNATVRGGGEAEGGIAPRAEDPTSPEQADARAEQRDAAQRQRGFGDDRAVDPLKD